MTRIPIRRMPLKRPPVVADRVIGQPLRWYQVQWDGGGGDYTDDGWYHDDEDDPTPSAGDTACLWRVTPGGQVIYWWDQTDDSPLWDICFGGGKVWVGGDERYAWVGSRGSFGDPIDLVGGTGAASLSLRIAHGGGSGYAVYGWNTGSGGGGFGRFSAAGATWSVAASAVRVQAQGATCYVRTGNGAARAIDAYDGSGAALGSVTGGLTGDAGFLVDGDGALYIEKIGDSYRTAKYATWDAGSDVWERWFLFGMCDVRNGKVYKALTSPYRCFIAAASDGSNIDSFELGLTGSLNDLAADDAGHVYVANDAGLYKFRESDGSRLWALEGINAKRVAVDDDGCAWVVGDRRYYDGTDWIAVP